MSDITEAKRLLLGYKCSNCRHQIDARKGNKISCGLKSYSSFLKFKDYKTRDEDYVDPDYYCQEYAPDLNTYYQV